VTKSVLVNALERTERNIFVCAMQVIDAVVFGQSSKGVGTTITMWFGEPSGEQVLDQRDDRLNVREFFQR